MIGVGGVGMAGLALLLKMRGHEVSGCDGHPSARTEWLAGKGITFFGGHSPSHIKGDEEIIVTPAVPANSPELVRARELGLTIRSRGETLANIVSSCNSIAIAGSHGKTTTSSWTARLLIALGERVEWCIGGETGAFPVAGIEGPLDKPSVLVVEADESDGTLALYSATTLVVTNCEYDHPDRFKTPEEYADCYNEARRRAQCVIEAELLPPIDHPKLCEVLKALPAHNMRNARTAVELALRRGHSIDDIANALPEIVTALPDRRFQVVSAPDSPLVIADYAHHPTEMACAISMARKICRGTLRVLFQPHRYSRTKSLLNDFPPALSLGDEIILCPTYAAFEQPTAGGGIEDLYEACRKYGKFKSLKLACSCTEAWASVRGTLEEGDVTLLLGAGDIINITSLLRA
ncbi:MAG: hypothetical protein J6R80_05430 [Kiritimatiellae bacterium]|nr:hypothetical protein [Kiritimatiellia bacterium]